MARKQKKRLLVVKNFTFSSDFLPGQLVKLDYNGSFYIYDPNRLLPRGPYGLRKAKRIPVDSVGLFIRSDIALDADLVLIDDIILEIDRGWLHMYATKI